MVLIPRAVATILLVGLGVVLGAVRGETYGA